MPTSDPIDILLRQNRWATRNLLESCEALPSEQFHQRFEIGPGSLHDTITHILAAMRGWGDMLAGRDQRPRLEGEQRTPQEPQEHANGRRLAGPVGPEKAEDHSLGHLKIHLLDPDPSAVPPREFFSENDAHGVTRSEA